MDNKRGVSNAPFLRLNVCPFTDCCRLEDLLWEERSSSLNMPREDPKSEGFPSKHSEQRTMYGFNTFFHKLFFSYFTDRLMILITSTFNAKHFHVAIFSYVIHSKIPIKFFVSL